MSSVKALSHPKINIKPYCKQKHHACAYKVTHVYG